jgi:hypothetical protein
MIYKYIITWQRYEFQIKLGLYRMNMNQSQVHVTTIPVDNPYHNLTKISTFGEKMYTEEVFMLCTSYKERTEEIADEPPVHRTNSTESSPSWDANSCSATQEIPSILSDPNVHYRIHKSSSMVFVLKPMNPIPSPILFLLDTMQ